MLLSSLVLGAVTGVALGLTGAGGGILTIPLLTFGAGLSHHDAAPIALVSIALAASLGAVLGLRAGVVRYRAALLVGGVGTAVAPLGVWLAARTSQGVLTLGLAAVMTISAVAMYRRSLGNDGQAARSGATPCYWSAHTGRFVWTRICAAVLTCIGVLTGSLSGLLGVGGGFLLVPALTRLSNLRVESIVSTSQTVVALVSTAGAVAAVAHHNIAWHIAVPFTAGAMTALGAARSIAARLPARQVQRSFSVLSGGIAVALLFSLTRNGLAV